MLNNWTCNETVLLGKSLRDIDEDEGSNTTLSQWVATRTPQGCDMISLQTPEREREREIIIIF